MAATLADPVTFTILVCWTLMAASTGAVHAASEHEAECRAAAGDHREFFELCLLVLDGDIDQARARIEARDVDGSTPLVWAVARGREELVDLLIASDAEANSATRSTGPRCIGRRGKDMRRSPRS